MPVEIGAVLWLAPRRPCTQPFIPWYLGINDLPDNYSFNDGGFALENHFEPIKNISKHAPDHHFPNYTSFAKKTDENYGKLIIDIKTKINMLETELLVNQEEFELQALDAYKKSPEKSEGLITDYTLEQVEKAEALMK